MIEYEYKVLYGKAYNGTITPKELARLKELHKKLTAKGKLKGTRREFLPVGK